MSDEVVAELPEGADPELAALRGKERGDKIREMYDNGAGVKRGELAKLFNVKYQVVYQYTKPPEGERQGRGKVILDNGMPRAEYIRQQFEAGRTRGEIAKELEVPYQIVYAATQTKKAEGEEGTDAAATPADSAPVEAGPDVQLTEDDDLLDG